MGNDTGDPNDSDDDTKCDRLSRMRKAIRDLDGPMSISNAQVPKRARTISTDEHPADEAPNPAPQDLGHVHSSVATARVTRDDGDSWKMWADGEASIACDDETFVEDLRRFA